MTKVPFSHNGYNYLHLWLLKDQPDYHDGYYFNDETEDLHGPFDTVEEAADAFDHYCREQPGGGA